MQTRQITKKMKLNIMERSDFRFDYTADEIPVVVSNLMQKTEALYRQIEKISLNKCTFENVFCQLSLIEAKNQHVFSIITFLQNVSTDSKIRDASREADEIIAKFHTKNTMRKKLYQRCQYIVNRDGWSSFDAIQQRLINHYMNAYRKVGMHLPDSNRKQLQKLMDRCDALMIEFGKNIDEDKTHLFLSTEDLTGLPNEFLERTKTEVEGQHKVRCLYVDIEPIYQYCQNADIRHLVFKTTETRCPENFDLLEELHRLRTQIAQLIGFSNSSEYCLQDETIKDPKKVIEFLTKVLDELDPHTRAYLGYLRNLKSLETVDCALQPWDYAYYHDKDLKENYQVDTQLIKQYFPAEYVTNKMLEFYAEMFSLNFRQIDDMNLIPQKWHPDVLTYQVFTGGQSCGYIYMDLYPRDGKYTHYAMWDLISGYRDEQDNQVYPIATLVGNFPKPVDDQPSLLNMREVETIFHEFGHVIHGICGGMYNQYYELAGTRTETDFVETPSQMKEQWVFEPLILAKISKHYQTGESLPTDLINKLSQSRHVGTSREWTRVSAMALIDQLVHGETVMDKQKMEEIYISTLNKYLYCQNPYCKFPSWGHMGSYGYHSKYYSYVLSMVLACDLYSKFIHDPTNPNIGLEYRQKILEPGANRSGLESIIDFLGRKPSIESFVRHYIGAIPQMESLELDLV